MDPTLPVHLVQLVSISAAPKEADMSLLALLSGADFIVLLVLFGLLGMSVTCWAIILNKWIVLRRATAQSQSFLDTFWKSPHLDKVYELTPRFSSAPVAQVFAAGYIELRRLTSSEGQSVGLDLGLSENIERALRRAANVELNQLERLTTFLATTGSTAPFIGLFGTVWGILRAFQRIGATGQATIATVGPDIAHALVATAVGLLAAIPAVMAYNYFTSRIKGLASEMDAFASDFLNIVKRHYRTSAR
jgi:biopolymer transport protein TolQ